MRTRWTALLAVAVLVGACGTTGKQDIRTTPNPTSDPTSEPTSAVAAMPDLVGLLEPEAIRRIGDLGLGSEWRAQAVRCGVRPGTVVRQAPAPGTPLDEVADARLRVAALDLDDFRGPCEPADGDLGPVTGPDAALARQFYRFAADPSLGAPFVDGDVWTGIEDALASTVVGPDERADLDAWRLHTAYAESDGPFSALDLVASSGGYYEVHRGIVGTCPAGNDDPPPELAGLRAISLIVPEDSISSCIQWWGVTLFLEDDQIRGVALRHGSP